MPDWKYSILVFGLVTHENVEDIDWSVLCVEGGFSVNSSVSALSEYGTWKGAANALRVMFWNPSSRELYTTANPRLPIRRR